MSRMMKVMVALLAIAAIAAPAMSATVYEKDGFKYAIKGDIQIQLRQDNGADQELDVEYDDLEIKNAISYDLGDGMKAFGELDFGFKKLADEDDDKVNFEEAYVGLQFDAVKVLMGTTDTSVDGFGIYGGIESYGKDDAFDAKGNTHSNDLIMVKGDFGDFSFVVSTELEAEGENSEDTSTYEFRVDYSIAGFSVGAAYQQIDDDTDDYGIMGVSAAYSMDKKFEIAADYSVATEYDGTNDYTIINVCASVPVGAVTLGAGYKISDDDAAADEINSYYGNVQYKFPTAKNVKLFAEIGGTDEEDNDDLGYLAGMQVKF